MTGGPGTGKTAVALWSARHALELPDGDAAKRALFLTFSRAAVRELLERAPAVLAGGIADRVEISTYHGFSAALLNAHRRWVGKGTEPLALLTDQEEALELGTPGALKYSELILEALALLGDAHWLADEYQARYSIVVCDEYQDTGSDMARLVEFLGRDTRVLCLVDLDQMIYEALPNSGVSAQRIDDLRARRPVEIALEPSSHRDPTNLMPRVGRAVLDRNFGDDAIQEALDADRLRVREYVGEFCDAVPDEIARVAQVGASTVGVFVSQRIMVEELADRLRSQGIEHEIAGLGAASGHAQMAVATLARYAVDECDWSEVLRRLALFHAASSSARRPPDIARHLAHAPELLPAGMTRYLAGVRTAADTLRGRPLSAVLDEGRRLWPGIFGGEKGAKLWELGVDDLVGQTLAWSAHSLDEATASAVSSIAEERQRYSSLEDSAGFGAPVRLMTTFQAKGRELDGVVLVHEPRDILPTNPFDRRFISTSRLHYVAITRARRSVSVLIPEAPHEFYRPFARLARV